MKAFQYAAPRREGEVVELLADHAGQTAILAGGTDLVPLMKKMIVTPDRVVSINHVDSLRGITADSSGVRIGAATTLDDVLDSPQLRDHTAIADAIRGISSPQLQAQGSLGGELLQRPRCWFFRNGYGLMAESGRLAAEGDNRFHAIFGNAGPAKFVCASRVAPALIALGARVRLVGPGSEDESDMPLEFVYRTPRDAHQHETVLLPNQLLTHVFVPAVSEWSSATYEVRHGAGPDYPLAAAAVALRIAGGMIEDARVVLGQVAPTPWTSHVAARELLGRPANADTAQAAGEAAVSEATPLANNRYKVQLAQVAVQRAVLLAAGLETGGF